MCLAIPVKVTQLTSDHSAIVEMGGIKKEISTALLEEVQVGDYVVIHVGFALTQLNESEAKKTLALLNEMV